MKLRAFATDVYHKTDVDIALNLKSAKLNTYLKYDVDVCVYVLQSGIDGRVLTNTVDINGQCNINATSNAIFNMQKVDVSILYDSLELSFSTGDNTSILNFNNNDIVPYLNLAALAVDVYNKTDVDIGLNIKAGKTNT